MTGRLAPLPAKIQSADAHEDLYKSIELLSSVIERDGVIEIDVFERSKDSLLGKQGIIVTAREIPCEADLPVDSTDKEKRRGPAASVLVAARSALIAAQLPESHNSEILQTRRRAATALPPRATLRVECLVKRASTYPLRVSPPPAVFGPMDARQAEESSGAKGASSCDESRDPFEFTNMLSKIWPDLFPVSEPTSSPVTAHASSALATNDRPRGVRQLPACDVNQASGGKKIRAVERFGPPPFLPPTGPLPPLPKGIRQEASLLTPPKFKLSEILAVSTKAQAAGEHEKMMGGRGHHAPRSESPVLSGRALPGALYTYF